MPTDLDALTAKKGGSGKMREAQYQVDDEEGLCPVDNGNELI